MLRRCLATSALLVLALLFLSVDGGAIGVRPLAIDLNLQPGDRSGFELILSPESTQQVVNLSLYQPIQMINGSLAYEKGDPSVYRAIDWVQLEHSRVVVHPGEETIVRGHIQVPFDAAGSYIVVVMVEPEGNAGRVEGASGVVFRVRYAVRIAIHVDRAGLRPTAEVMDFRLQPDEQSRPIAVAHISNPSPLMYSVSAEATIRDENRRLVQRIDLQAQAARDSGLTSIKIFPGAELQLVGAITEPLFPGDYELRLFLRYADGRQIIRREQISLTGDEFAKEDRMTYLSVTPKSIDVNLRAGGAVTQVVEVLNRSSETISVQFAGRDAETDYSHSIYDSLEVNLRGQAGFTLEPRRSGRGIFTIQAPRELLDGGYYGDLQVAVLSEGGDLLEVHTVPMSAIVGSPSGFGVEILSLQGDYQDGECLLSLAIQNMSNVHVVPTATAHIKDGSGVVISTLDLTLQEGSDRILPEKVGYLTAETDDFEPGEYVAEIIVSLDAQELARQEMPLVVAE